MVGRAYLSFASTAPRFGRRGRVVGNPVRAEIVAQAARAAMDAEGFEARARTVLVLGGSQGAKALNDTVPEVLAAAGAVQSGLRVIHQTGKDAQPRVAEHYARLGVDAEVVPFIDDMATAYSEAALVIARAGATTLAELAALGRPSLLVPYPFAADNHQTKNARAFEAAGAAWCVPQDEMDVEAMAHWTRELWGDAARRRLMAEAARGLGRPDAAAVIVDDLCEWLGWLPDGGRKVSAHADGSAGESTTAVDDVGIEGDESGETLPGLGPSDVQVPSNEEVSSDKEAQLPAIACDSRVDLNGDSDRVSDGHLDADSALPLDRAMESALVWNRNEAEGVVHGEALRIASDWASRWGMSDSFVTDSFDEDASGSEQLRGEGAYVPRFRARPLVERRPLVFAERLAWD